MPHLVARYGGTAATVADGGVIGAAEDAAVRVVMPGISRHHARVSFTGTGWVIEDSGSTNGTFVDGVRVDRLEFVPPVEVRLGHPTEGEVVLLEPPAVADADPVTETLRRLVIATWVMAVVLAVLVVAVVVGFVIGS